MAFTIKNPLQKASPLQQHVEGHPFNLEQQLQKERVEETVKNAKNFKLKTNNFDLSQTPKKSTVLDNFKKFNANLTKKMNQSSLDRATGTADSRGGEAKRKAFGDYATALGNSQYYGEKDQFGQEDRGFAEKERGGIELDPRGPYAARDVAVPFSTLSKAAQKRAGLNRAQRKLQKELPYLSNYADYVPSQINQMYIDPNSGAFSNQVRRDALAGVVGQKGTLAGAIRLSKDNDQNFYGPNQSAHSYMGGYMHRDGFGNVSTRMFRPTDEMNDPFTQAVGPGGKNYRLGGASDQQAELRIGEAVGASNEAFNAIQNAINSGNFELANEILSSAQAGINNTFKNTDTYAGTRRGYGDSRVLDSPGTFFGGRVRDNLQYRTDQSSNLYNQDYLPTRNEEIDRAAYNKYLMEKMRQTVRDTDYSLNFDTRGGERF